MAALVENLQRQDLDFIEEARGISLLMEQCSLSQEQAARALGKSVAFFVGKLDSSHAHFYRVLSALAGQYGAVICPIIVPYIEGEEVKSYINLIENKACKLKLKHSHKQCDNQNGICFRIGSSLFMG